MCQFSLDNLRINVALRCYDINDVEELKSQGLKTNNVEELKYLLNVTRIKNNDTRIKNNILEC